MRKNKCKTMMFISSTHMDAYLQGRVAYEDAVRKITKEDCNTVVEVHPYHFNGKNIAHYAYAKNIVHGGVCFTMVDTTTGEVLHDDREYLYTDTLAYWFMHTDTVKLMVHARITTQHREAAISKDEEV